MPDMLSDSAVVRGGTEVFTLRRIGADSEQVITTRLRINQFQIVFIAAVFGLLVLLT